MAPALWAQHRYRSKNIKIANRKKVELFVATRFHLPTRLRTAAPDVAAEWDYDRNPGFKFPETVGIGHMEPVWWKCRRCGCSYEMSVEKRVVRGGGCDCCAAPKNSLTHGEARDERPAVRAEALLDGELNPALRSKRSTVLNTRTKY